MHFAFYVGDSGRIGLNLHFKVDVKSVRTEQIHSLKSKPSEKEGNISMSVISLEQGYISPLLKPKGIPSCFGGKW